MIRTGSLLLLLLWVSDGTAEPEPVRAEIGKKTAWTGEAVPLIITLYSPGPFDGTASFDLPELPRTAFVKAGDPLVGNEDVDGKSFFTQRHEFKVYTQREGEIVIPKFRVRFAGKKTFTSRAEPMEGTTPELRFQSKRPPGTDNLGVVVAATRMEATQTWSPASPRTVKAGDVIERAISRRAAGTTAMMLPAPSAEAPDGVRVYPADPVVQDHTERGESTAQRTDTIKYQFERPGTYTLPELSLVWWDAKASELKRTTLPGETITVEGTTAVAPAEQVPGSHWPYVVLILAVGIAGLLLFKPASRLLARWRAELHNPEATVARRLLASCKSDDAPAAYAALLDWKRAIHLDRLPSSSHARELEQEWTALSRYVFGVRTVDAPWSGHRLAETFRRVRHELNRTAHPARDDCALPSLNPTGSTT